jgi:ATP-dependent RNA helicase DeaD
MLAMSDITFQELELIEPLLDAIRTLGYEKPSPVQALTIPVALAGRDLVGLSQTGSGKTAAFGLPLLQKLDLKRKEVQAIILCPTRELAMQVCEEIHRLSAHMRGFSAVPVYGGAPMFRQMKALRAGAQVVVGTPGRVIDLLDRGSLNPSAIQMVVLDEADRMLDMGFRDDMEKILGVIDEGGQRLFFSATMNRDVEKLIRKFSNNPEILEIRQKTITVERIEQVYYEVRNRSKIEVLSRLLDLHTTRRGIVFCNTKQMVDDCTEALLARGYTADRIHGDIAQQGRERVISRFRDGSIELLVATDVAARGLDIDNVEVVFNYDLPYDPEDYVHRIGRTGRAGKAGRAVTFVYGRDIHRLEAIERFTRGMIKRLPIPTAEEVEGRRNDQTYHQVRDLLESGNFDNHEASIDRLLDQGYTPTDIGSALFTLLRSDENRKIEKIEEDTEVFRQKPAGGYAKGPGGGGGGNFKRKFSSKKPFQKSAGKGGFKKKKGKPFN